MSNQQMTMTPDMTKLVNRQVVLDHLLHHSPTTRAQIARHLKLSKPTVSTIVSELVRDGFARELGIKRYGQGRPSIEVEANPIARYAIGIEVDVSSALFIVTDLLTRPIPGTPVCIQREIDTATPERAASSVAAAIKSILADVERQIEDDSHLEERWPRLMGIGIGAPAVVNSKTMQIISSNPLNWSGPAPFGSIIQEQVSAPVLVTQRVMAAAWAERVFGSARSAKTIVYARFGSGVASGIIVNDQLYSGADYFAGNIADMCFLPYGSSIDLTQPVSLQSLVTRNAITARARELLREGYFTSSYALDAAGGDPHRITLEMLCAGALRNDCLSRRVITESGRFIGIAVANLVSVLNPEMVVLGGPLTLAGNVLIESIVDQVRRCCKHHEQISTRIVISELGDRASALGAADLAIRQFLNPLRLPDMRTPL